ncbi:MAG: hypothetical protein OQK46_04685 [Gammaproteobacteria bacterium]|nr:hypothetical protein [Gammaproteobacteria bacterium]
MYNCSFIKYLWKDLDKKRKLRTLEKKIVLPFPPSLGQEICENEWFSGKIERVVWDNTTQFFTIKVSDIKPKEGISAELLLDVALKQGWEEQLTN